MTNRMTLADCIRLAEFAHFHQRDKSGAEYIDHPKRVLAAVQDQGAPPYVQMAAILHDVTEDTPFTPDMLLDLGVPEAAVNLVRRLDRGESARIYDELMAADVHENDRIGGTKDEFYYLNIRNTPGALQVKLADIGDNMQPWRLSYLPEKTQQRLREKYTKATEFLTNPERNSL